MPSGYEPTRELRELLIKKTFLGDSAPNERNEKVVQYVIHRINEDVSRADERVCSPRARGSENAQTQTASSETVAHHP